MLPIVVKYYLQSQCITFIKFLYQPLIFFFFGFSYFSASSSLSLSSWTSSTAGALTPCGHCDNCTRPPETVDRRDVTLETWQILQVVYEVERQGGRVTLGMMSDLIRGAGGGAFGVVDGDKKGTGNARKKVGLDLDEIAGGKVALSKDVSSLVHLMKIQFMVVTLRMRKPCSSNCYFLII